MLLILANQRGLDVKELQRRWKLPTEVELDPATVPLPQWSTPAATLRGLSDELAEKLNDPSLGLTLAKLLARGSYGVAEFLIRSVPTLRMAFENVVRFSGLIAPDQTFAFVEEGDEAQVHNAPTLDKTGLGRHLNEYTTAIHADVIRSIAGACLVRAWFINPAPASTRGLVNALGTERLAFNQPTNGCAIERKSLELPVKNGDPALYGFLEEQALAALSARPKSDDLVDQLRAQIRDALKQGEPNVERLAIRMELSARTLQRRLSALGTSFQDVLDGVRFDLARAFLSDDRLDVSQVAYLLGYSELRAFDRAFKRWAGMAPGTFRSKSR